MVFFYSPFQFYPHCFYVVHFLLAPLLRGGVAGCQFISSVLFLVFPLRWFLSRPASLSCLLFLLQSSHLCFSFLLLIIAPKNPRFCLNQPQGFGMTPLLVACEFSTYPLVTFLLERGADAQLVDSVRVVSSSSVSVLCLLCWFVGWLVGWLVGQSFVCWLVGWLVGCLDGWMVGCLDGWMVGWLDGWMGG